MVQSIKEWDHRRITTPKAMKGFLEAGWMVSNLH